MRAQSASMASTVSRTLPGDMADDAATSIFNAYVPLASCTPEALFVFDTRDKWKSCMRYLSMLSEILDSTGGRIPHQRTLNRQLSAWLREQGFHWWSLEQQERVKAAGGEACILQALATPGATATTLEMGRALLQKLEKVGQAQAER